MKNKVTTYIMRKWWYRWIRSLNWFSFRYYWFNWFMFILLSLLLILGINKPILMEGCNSDIIHESIQVINERLDDCCKCELNQALSPHDSLTNTDSNPKIPEDAVPCNTEVIPGTINSGQREEKLIYLGPEPGNYTLKYNLFSCCDYIKVEYNGTVLESTGCEFQDGQLSFSYNPIAGNYSVKVTVIGGPCTTETNWQFHIECPN